MKPYFVSTKNCYVVINATSAQEARELAIPKFRKIFERPEIEIHIVREATDEEVSISDFHRKKSMQLKTKVKFKSTNGETITGTLVALHGDFSEPMGEIIRDDNGKTALLKVGEYTPVNKIEVKSEG